MNRTEGSTPQRDTTYVPLIATGTFGTPTWARINRQVAGSTLWRTARAVPRAIQTVVSLAWCTSRRWTAVAAIANFLAGCLRAVGLFGTVGVLAQLISDEPTPQRVKAAIPALAVVTGAYAGKALLDSLIRLAQASLAPPIESGARHRMLEAVLKVPASSFDDADFTELVRQGGMHGVWAIRRSIQVIANLVAAVVTLTAASVTIAVLNIWLLPALILAAGVDVWAAMHAARLSYESFLRMVSSDREAWIIGDLITDRDAAAETRAFALQRTLLREHQAVTERLNAEAVRVEQRRTAIQLGGRCLAGIGTTLAYTLLGFLLYKGQVPLSVAGAAVIAMGATTSTLSQAAHQFNGMYENSFYIALYRELLDRCRTLRQDRTGSVVPTVPEVIEFEGVSYTYPGQRTPALRHVSFTLRRGETVALVGENGSGKSTIGKLLVGLYTPTEGRILWDGEDIAGADLTSMISYIGQEPVRWPVTAADNIRISSLDRERRDGMGWNASARVSGADAVIESLPYGENTVLSSLSEEGSNLSTGQWQRIGVARGDYRDAPILIVDEPTSALDARAERKVFDALLNADHRSDRTTVLITHRLDNVSPAHHIIVLDNGCLTQSGTHEELMRTGGLYAELHKLQSNLGLHQHDMTSDIAI